MPKWRVSARKVLGPYGRFLCVITLLAMAALVANDFFEWSLLGLNGRKSEAAALLLGLMAYIFILPTPDDLRKLRETGGSLRDWKP